jgi:hypothetical protein
VTAVISQNEPQRLLDFLLQHVSKRNGNMAMENNLSWENHATKNRHHHVLTRFLFNDFPL